MATLNLDVIYRDRGAERGMRQLGDTTERTSKRFSGLKIAGAVALAAVGVGAVRFASSSVKAYVQAETAQAKLQDAYRRFPRLADVQIGSLQRLNTELAKKTRFDDDATASGQAVLAQFKLTGQQITQLTPLLQDYAARTGKDLPAAATDLGRAMLGQGRSLKAVGINFKDTGSAGGNFDQIMRGLRTQVGGFAEREGKTAAGQAAILRNQFGELQEAAGQQLLPALLKVGQNLLRFTGFVQQLSPTFGAFKRIAVSTFNAFSDSVGGGRASFKSFGDFVRTNQSSIIVGFVAVAKAALAIGRAIATMASVGLRGMAFLSDAMANQAQVFLGSFRIITRAAAFAFGWIPGIGDKLRAADRNFAAFSATAVGGMRRTSAGLRSAADGIDKRLRPALDAAGKKLDEVGRKEIIKAKTRDAVNRAAIAIRNVGTAADGSQVHLKRWSDRTNLGAAAQRQLEQRIQAARGRMLELRAAGERAGDSQAKLTSRWNQGREALFREFRQMGLSRTEARRLADQYGKIPKKAETKVTQPGMRAARVDTKDLDNRINGINGRKVRINYSSNAAAFAKGFGIKMNFSAGTKAFGGSRVQVGNQAGPSATFSHGHGPESGGPGITRTISTPVHGRPGLPKYDTLTDRMGKRLGDDLGVTLGKKLDAARAAAAPSPGTPGGRVGTVRAGRGWGPIQAAMRRHGARSFTTYPGHHPSMARARDVTPHNWAMANAARRLSSVWYVIYRMRIASKNRGNTWRPYTPIRRTGDFRHVRHIHVARYGNGTGSARGGMALVGEHGAELLQMRGGERVTPMTSYNRVGGGGGGMGNTTIIINAPNYVGSQADLRDTIVKLHRDGKLKVLSRA